MKTENFAWVFQYKGGIRIEGTEEVKGNKHGKGATLATKTLQSNRG